MRPMMTGQSGRETAFSNAGAMTHVMAQLLFPGSPGWLNFIFQNMSRCLGNVVIRVSRWRRYPVTGLDEEEGRQADSRERDTL